MKKLLFLGLALNFAAHATCADNATMTQVIASTVTAIAPTAPVNTTKNQLLVKKIVQLIAANPTLSLGLTASILLPVAVILVGNIAFGVDEFLDAWKNNAWGTFFKADLYTKKKNFSLNEKKQFVLDQAETFLNLNNTSTITQVKSKKGFLKQSILENLNVHTSDTNDSNATEKDVKNMYERFINSYSKNSNTKEKTILNALNEGAKQLNTSISTDISTDKVSTNNEEKLKNKYDKNFNIFYRNSLNYHNPTDLTWLFYHLIPGLPTIASWINYQWGENVLHLIFSAFLLLLEVVAIVILLAVYVSVAIIIDTIIACIIYKNRPALKNKNLGIAIINALSPAVKNIVTKIKTMFDSAVNLIDDQENQNKQKAAI